MTSADPATAKGRHTRDRIIRAVVTLVAERGVAGTSLEDVRESACVSKSQLYHYFADRDDLMRCMARAVTDDVLDGQAALFAQLDTLEGLHAWADALVETQRQRQARGGCPIGSLAGQLAEHDDHTRLELAEGFDRWQAAIRDGLRQMADRDELRDDADPDLLAQRTLAAVQGGLLLTQVRRDPNELRRALDGAIDAIRAARTDP